MQYLVNFMSESLISTIAVKRIEFLKILSQHELPSKSNFVNKPPREAGLPDHIEIGLQTSFARGKLKYYPKSLYLHTKQDENHKVTSV